MTTLNKSLSTPPSLQEAFTFDDVLIEPSFSNILPRQADTETYVTRHIKICSPLISAAMDLVTESPMAIAMAQAGGIGVIHRNLSIKNQSNEVRRVKKFEAGMVVDPLTIQPHKPLSEAMNIMREHKISGIPVLQEDGKLVGILTNRDVRFVRDGSEPVSSVMTKNNLVTVPPHVKMTDAKRLLHEHRIEKLLVVDENFRCVGLITVKDIEKAETNPLASKDQNGRLRVAAAISTGAQEGIARAEALAEAGADIIVIDTAHGHSKSVLETLIQIKKMNLASDIMVGNVATEEGALALIEAGADAVKVGIGPGSICTTRIVAGVGVPQLSAIMRVASACAKSKVPVIADGGIKFSGDFAKALAAGANCAMIGSLLAGTDEAPGEVYLYQGRAYKAYRGMGSVAAMAQGSADRYFQDSSERNKFVPEGVEGQVPYKGSVQQMLYQLMGGLRAAMGYTGAATIEDFRTKTRLIRVSLASLRESHPHDVTITRESPNYPVGESSSLPS